MIFYRPTWGYNHYNNAAKKQNQTKEIEQP